MVERSKHFSFTLKSAESIGIVRKLIGKGFNRNVTFKFRVSCPIHLAHVTATNDGENFDGAKSGAGEQAQLCSTLMRE